MWRVLKLSFGLVLFLARSVTAAEEGLIDENLLAAAPPGYEIGFNDKSDNGLISEWVPKGETVENWTEMVTVQVFYHLDVAPEVFLRDLEKRWRAACPDAEAAHVIAKDAENGYPTQVWLLDCPKNPATGKREVTWFKTIAGHDSFYLVQKAFKFEPSPEQIGRSMDYLKAVGVCDSRLKDRACPRVEN